MAKVRTCLWFDGTHLEAVHFYTGLIPGSRIDGAPNPEHPPVVIDFTLAGTPYQALNGGPHYTHTPAASIQVMTEDQAETDRLWAALIAGGGAESRCGWCVDRFGVSWQVVPRQLVATVGGPDPDGARRATEAMLKMTKIDIATLEAAYRGA
ncbi:VOC family protein [Maritimibacter fusiformis]|uniref:VOC family protein n=1 Tax=Maritimibacter fusiformis TaxID=2603819 RepID=A0A5D0RMN9_9RHOB|nr:VOC family protein [Maritimibacter fusiformis]TYB82917.1 VOC family protein [Maritimibacter fusiformis]